MGWFNLDPYGQDRIDAMPGTTEVPEAGAFSGLLSAIPKGIAGGLVKVGQLGNALANTDTGFSFFESPSPNELLAHIQHPAPDSDAYKQAAAAVKVVNEWTATGQDPRKTGGFGRILDNVSEGLTIGLAGNAVAGPWGAASLLGTSEGYSSYKDTRAEGLDHETAKEEAIVHGVTAAAGALVPLKFGDTVGSNVLAGIGSNVGLGMLDRGLTASTLESHGYHEMATHYRMADGEALAADIILGSAFGALGHYTAEPHRVNPADVDAAAAVATEEHFNRSAPGAFTDPGAATLHADTMAASLRALHDGDVPTIPEEAAQRIVDNAVPDPIHDMAAALHEAATEDLPGYAAAAANVPRVELPELKPAPLWSAIWESTWQTADYLTTGGLIRSIVEDPGNPERTGSVPHERGAPWSVQSQGGGVPLDTFHDALLGDLVHNFGDEVYEYRPTYDFDGMHVEPITYRQLAEEMQQQRDEIETFGKLHEVAAACFVRHGMGADLLPKIQLGNPYLSQGTWHD